MFNAPSIVSVLTRRKQSLQNDMQRIYDTKETKKNMKRPWELPPLKIRSTTKGTVFGQSFLSVTLDEAHNARNLSLNYYASLRVFQQAIIKLALTLGLGSEHPKGAKRNV
jgi:hypothetical protein